MMADGSFDNRRNRYRLQDPGTDDRVFLHQLPFLRGELTGLAEDIIGDADLAHVVQITRIFEIIEQATFQTQLATDHQGVFGDPVGVTPGRRVLGVDRLG